MSTTIDQAFIKQFEREVHEAFQRQGSKLRNTVRVINNVNGSEAVFQKVGKGTASTKSTHGMVPVMNLDHSAVTATLQKVAALPITTWKFKDLKNGRHLGPMAQYFHAAFGLGNTDKGITTVDEGGVALAAIQGLNQKMETRDQRSEVRIQKLEAENTELRQELQEIKQLLSNLTKKGINQ